ncbi:rod shape-determining protein MreC [Leptolyngbya sp. 'hensonii']|uniref:rod shape-determining protein MreC n=1 Tax=Leptolyngbya sp. 'hensonii' TaxID=1922337 RepID=UPI000950325E|nr:rod shape-determining protein MreC [Leptolyngbya sp. 'hensonii']OLP18798.1 rod shape-determining protein MreC [Leptolyngbya sp. 'hensonii']
MYTIRRWWDRYGLQALLVTLALGAAWSIRQTQGSLIFEAYRWTARPFQASPIQEDRLVSSRVRELQDRLRELEGQNQKLRELVGYVKANQQAGVVAPVVGRSADHWWQQITLGRGSKDGVKVGDIVSGTGGLVGQVINVTPHTSRVLLISDPTSQVGVTVSRTRYTGYMRGQSETQATIEFFDKVPDVRVGDAVSTSAFSQLFPPGLPIGRIVAVNLSKSPAPEATVEFSAPISYVEWVVIYPNPKASSGAPQP